MIPLPTSAWVGLGGVVAFGALFFVDANRIADRDVTIANMTASAAKLETARATAETNLTKANASFSIQLQKQVSDAQHALDLEHESGLSFLAAAQAETAKANGRVGGAVAESGRLRQQLATFANSGDGSSGDATLAAVRDRAAALGDVLSDVLSAEAGYVAAAEDHSAGVRALLEAWPSSCTAPGLGGLTNGIGGTLTGSGNPP